MDHPSPAVAPPGAETSPPPSVSDFTTAAAATLQHLHRSVGMDTWALARRDGEDYVVLSALDAGQVGLRAGDVMAWDDTFCAASVAGGAPGFSTRVEQEPGWAHALTATGFPWRSYVSVPLLAPDGTLLGTLCGGALDAVDPATALRLPEIELAADLLATVLSYELRLVRESHRAERAEAVAERDALTGVGNRRAWDTALAAEETRAQRLGSTASVLVLDLDGLKALNDTRGHDAGDEVIRCAARVVDDHLRPEDLVVRLGGDEFAALLPDADRARAAAVAERLRAELGSAGVRVSIGAATRRAATGLGVAWHEADAAMYADKAARRVAPERGDPGATGTGPAPRRALDGDVELGRRIERLLETARRQLGVETAVLAEFHGDTWTLRHVATAAGAPDPRGFSTHRGGTYCQRVLDGHLEPVVVDAAAHPVTSGLPITAALDIGAYVGVPVHFEDGTLYGTLCALSSTPQPDLRTRDAGVLEIVAEALGELVTRGRRRGEEHRSVLTRLDELDRSGGPRPVYQPVVELAGLQGVGVEALSRFPAGTPDSWFADARRVGAGERLELAALLAALAQRPRGAGFLSLNVSPALCLSPALARALAGHDPAGLVLEITEHEAVDDYPALLRHLSPLRAAGLRIAVDDAGAGFASMRHVLALGPEFIKLDLSLIRDVHLDATRRALAASLTTFARHAGAHVVAEGIETAEELECLRGLGVSHGQGFHLGRPVPAGGV
ncbi:EAL domain-containing protein [Kineococcus sp. GCM10028916]|uniref:EAL domain-containing protein n=1 Tax=Kineococcus sp. GCM10028916 TaxID=3273394 RepID=UPI00362AD26C